MSQKVIYAYKNIDTVIDGFIPHEVRGHFHIYDHSIIKFGIIGFCLGFSNTYNVGILDRYRDSIVDKVITELCILKYIYHSTEHNMKIKYAN